jgi:hypothetical protein
MGEHEGDSRNRGPAIALVNTSRLVGTDPARFPEARFLDSEGPGLRSGQSGKELVLAKAFLHPETEPQAVGVPWKLPIGRRSSRLSPDQTRILRRRKAARRVQERADHPGGAGH